METVTLEKGVIEAVAPVPDRKIVRSLGGADLALDSLQAPVPNVGSDSPVDAQPIPEAQKPSYGYRQDSPPEVIALLEQAQAGDTEAFADLYRLHITRLTSYVGARMKFEDRQAVPDVVQDAFCEAFADLPHAHHDVTGWLLAHAAKAYIRYIRSVRRQERAVAATKDVVRREYAHGYPRQHPGTITAIGHVMLVHAIARLSPGQREVVQHRYLEGQTQQTTALAMGKSLTAVKSTEHRALVKMRGGLANTEATTE